MRRDMESVKKKLNTSGVDWTITIFPLVIIICISALLMVVPDAAGNALTFLKNFLLISLAFSIFCWGWAFFLRQWGSACQKREISNAGVFQNPNTVISAGAP